MFIKNVLDILFPVCEIAPAKDRSTKNNKNPNALEFLVKYNKKTGAIQAATEMCQFTPHRIKQVIPANKIINLINFFWGFMVMLIFGLYM